MQDTHTYTNANHSSDSSVVEIETMTAVLSDDSRRIFEFVNFMTICDIVGLFGIIANIINLIVFYKQGFSYNVNIALFGLTISDICCLVMLVWSSICLNPLLATSRIPWRTEEVMYLTGAWPHVCFCRITSFITVYITVERYLSIAIPLKIKQIVTPKRTTLTICLIYVVNIMTLVPEYTTSYLDWVRVPERNISLLGIKFTSSRPSVDGLCYVMHSLFSMTSFFGVVVFTCVLVIKLRQSSEWRQKTTLYNENRSCVSAREQRTVKMVVLIASILIVCYIPGASIATAVFIVGPDLSIKGRHINICVAIWSIAYCFQSVNSSINIFIYYRMSSKYRDTFQMFFNSFIHDQIKSVH